MPNPKTSSQDWFYHSPGSKSKDGPQDHTPLSQIPGLTSNTELTQDEIDQDPHLRRKWIRDTDSEYVKLAKAGGRRDLFQYREYKSSGNGPRAYPRVDWFDHTAPPEEEEAGKEKISKPTMPNWYMHEEYVCQESDFIPSKSKRPLLGFDDLSVWKRDELDLRKRDEKLPPINKQKLKGAKTAELAAQLSNNALLPPIPSYAINKEEGEMSQLLSMGYQSDWLKEQEQRRKRQQEAKTEEKKKYQEKLDRDQEFINRKKKKEVVPEVKPLFKISKFGNVSSRVDTFRT